MATDPLARFKRALENERRAQEEVRAALRAAHEEQGLSYAELGRLLGVSRQAVRERLVRD